MSSSASFTRMMISSVMPLQLLSSLATVRGKSSRTPGTGAYLYVDVVLRYAGPISEGEFFMPASRGALVARAGVMASLAAVCQLAAGFFPGPGHVLSVFGTLPIALVAYTSPVGGLLSLLAASSVVFLLQPLETPILLFVTGPIGLVLGWAANRSWPRVRGVLLATAALAGGMMLITYGLSMPAFGDGLTVASPWMMLAISLGFAFVYNWLWALCLPWLFRRLSPRGINGAAGRPSAGP